jgi:hypothetical protein
MDASPLTQSAPTAAYPDRFADLFASRGEPAAILSGRVYKLYSNMVVPFGPAELDYTLSPRESAGALKQLGGILVRTTNGFAAPPAGSDWYAVVCRSFTDVADLRSSNTRSKLRRGLRNCEARRMTPDEFARLAYDVFLKARERYGDTSTPPTREHFDAHVRGMADFDDIVEYWGVFCDGELAGCTINYVFGTTEVLYSAVKLDPAYLRRYSSYALFHRMNEHYLGERGFAYANNGFRSILHETQVQDFLEQNFGFEKLSTRLETTYRWPVGALVRGTFPLRRVTSRVDERLRALYEMERVVRATRN